MSENEAPANTSVPAAQTNVEKPAPVATAAPVSSAAFQTANPAPVATVAPAATVQPVAQPAAQPITEPAELEEPKPDELSMLKARATLMGITYSNNIGLDALKQKITEKISGETKTEEPEPEDEIEVVDERSAEALAKPALTLRQRLMQDNMRLIRVRITNLDPKKKDLPGEIITVANRFIGTVRKFVPYGEVTEGGYHVPYVIFKMLKKRKFLNIRVRPNPKGGQDIIESKYVPEFAIEELPQLTPVELERLARAQIAAGSVEAGGVQ